MERKAMQDLINWKNKKNRKPLLIYGARQVGKTYLVKEFGNRYFEDIIYIRLHIGPIFDPVISQESPIDMKSTQEFYDILEFIYALSKQIIEIAEEEY